MMKDGKFDKDVQKRLDMQADAAKTDIAEPSKQSFVDNSQEYLSNPKDANKRVQQQNNEAAEASEYGEEYASYDEEEDNTQQE